MSFDTPGPMPPITEAELADFGAASAKSPSARFGAPSKARRPQPQRHRWFEHWLIPTGRLHDLAAGLIGQLEELEANHPYFKRTKSRRPGDQANFEAIVQGCLANLAVAVLDPAETGKLSVLTGNPNRQRTRYDRRPFVGKQFPTVLRLLDASGFAVLGSPSVFRGESSSLAPTEQLTHLIRRHQIGFEHIVRDPNEELLVLTRRRTGEKPAELLDYEDSDETDWLREQVIRLNRYLAHADVQFLDDGLGRVNTFARTSSRRFFVDAGDTVSFHKGGRLYGGFWVNLKSDRRRHIRINGAEIADLDFKSMFCRLAYAEVGAKPPPGDLYAIEGLEGYRSGVKMAVNTLFWDDYKGRRSWPDGMGIGVGDDGEAKEYPGGLAAKFDGLLPAGWGRPKLLKDAFLRKHPGLKEAFGRGIGPTLMYRESVIMVTLLDELMRLGVVALPVHDGLSVPRSRVAETRKAMEAVAHQLTGLEFPVEEKA